VKLTPLDIRKQEFKKVMRGFDPEEVEAFLGMVADELESLIHERNKISDELIKLRTQLRDYQQVEHTLRDTLMKATSTVEESRVNSLREAELRIQEAELQAEKIVENAKDELQELRHEITLLRTQKESFSRRLRHLLESQIELIDVLGMDDVTTLESADEPRTRFTPRGRLPRPVLTEQMSSPAEPAPPEQEMRREPLEEPRIIRNEKRFEEPMVMRRPGGFEPPASGTNNEDNRGKSGNRLSDQFAV
jgi:DivIVA domain-containing protein